MKPKHTFRGVVIHEEQLAHRSSGPRWRGLKPATVAPVQAGPPKVRVAREVSGRGGKAVSVITGLPLSGAALEELATRLKKLCGAGGAVKNSSIEIQGEHRDRLVAELCKLGYEAKRSGG
ncbi:MAG TPA: stress response translation initiation inhibitor YciH [Steroidobacteraceae bacterium]|nr:stress response translation initiation inhibitor YciH [Steroidobacteraceae bacterium]